jgi:hypothetical protein
MTPTVGKMRSLRQTGFATNTENPQFISAALSKPISENARMRILQAFRDGERKGRRGPTKIPAESY